MLGTERKQRIVDYVRKHHSASVNSLAKEFDVHEVTIRRDLIEIEQEGLLKRTHGGVVVEQWNQTGAPYAERKTLNLDEKMRIGKMAASLVEEGDHIILDSGTTTPHIAENLVHRSNITVVTNDIHIASILREAEGIKVIVTGGELHHSRFLLTGVLANHALRNIHTHKAFISNRTLHPQYGLMHPDSQFVQVKQWMIEAAQEVIVVADHSKLGNISLHTVAPITSIHVLVTGREAPEQQLQPFRERGVTVYTA